MTQEPAFDPFLQWQEVVDWELRPSGPLLSTLQPASLFKVQSAAAPSLAPAPAGHHGAVSPAQECKSSSTALLQQLLTTTSVSSSMSKLPAAMLSAGGGAVSMQSPAPSGPDRFDIEGEQRLGELPYNIPDLPSAIVVGGFGGDATGSQYC